MASFVVTLALMLGTVAGPTAGAPVDEAVRNLAERRLAPAAPAVERSACHELVELLCRRSDPEFCARVREEASRRPLTEADEQQCREVLEDQDKLAGLLRTVPRP